MPSPFDFISDRIHIWSSAHLCKQEANIAKGIMERMILARSGEIGEVQPITCGNWVGEFNFRPIILFRLKDLIEFNFPLVLIGFGALVGLKTWPPLTTKCHKRNTLAHCAYTACTLLTASCSGIKT